MKLKRILLAIKKPTAWRILYESFYSFFTNVIQYQNFSVNRNTKKVWNNIFLGAHNFWRDEHYHYVLDIFPKDKEFSLLDIGCAIGCGCELLHEKFPKAKITGVDISDVGIETAKQKNKDIDYFVLDILKDPIPGTYDWITIVETLEHFDDPFSVIDKCLAHVREALIISVPYKQKLSSSKKMTNVAWHRHVFDEETFINYNCNVVKVTEYIESTKAQCIIYEIKPK